MQAIVRWAVGAAACAGVVATALQASAQDQAARVSAPGRYSGYSEARFDGVERTSIYIPMRDGTPIAIDILRPTSGGIVTQEALPVVWMNTPYNRRVSDEGGATTQDYPGAAEALVRYGYVVAVADMRGNGASFGSTVHYNRAMWIPSAYWDGYDITEFLAAQPWSDGNIGMWGCSATGHSQWQTAATNPPHLRAIFAMSAPSEYYDWGGIHDPQDLVNTGPWPGAVPQRDALAVPVDADTDGALLAAAMQEHRWNIEPGAMPFRDSIAPDLAATVSLHDFRYWQEVNTFAHLDAIAASGIAIYQTSNAGEDIRVRQGVVVKQATLGDQVRTIMAPGAHCAWSSPYRTREDNAFDITVEELRFFDHHLKGVENGIEDEPPVTFFTHNAAPGSEWRQAWQWPLATARAEPFYFAAGDPAPMHGALSNVAPQEAGAADRYAIDYSVTNETMAERGLSFTGEPLVQAQTLAGSPVLHLWVASDAADLDFVAFVEDIAPDGSVRRLPGTTEGRLRASHRVLGNAPFDTAGLPYHRSFAEDVRPLEPGVPAELVFDLAPVAWVFAEGHRIRVVLSNVARSHRGGRSITPVLDPAPTVTLLRDPAHPSRIELPMLAPVTPLVAFERRGGGLRAILTFPPTVDPRMIADAVPGSVRQGALTASNVSVHGRVIVAEFPAGASETGSVQGQFGARFDYGPGVEFVSRAD